MMRYLLTLFLLPLFISSPMQAAEPIRSWVVYYSDKLPAETFMPYDLVVFDRDYHPPIRKLKSHGKTVLGYISFAEAETYRDDFDNLKAKGFVIDKENPYWPGHFFIDIRKPGWTKYVIEQIIPDVIRKGFDGIMVDTLDSAIDLERRYPKEFAGFTEASAAMIKAVRRHYPGLQIMVNRGFELLPMIEQDIDYLMAESIMVKHHTDDKSYSLFPEDVYAYYLTIIGESRERAPGLQVVSVDYWDMADIKGVQHVYRTQRASEFIPYVTTISLQEHHAEPK